MLEGRTTLVGRRRRCNASRSSHRARGATPQLRQERQSARGGCRRRRQPARRKLQPTWARWRNRPWGRIATLLEEERLRQDLWRALRGVQRLPPPTSPQLQPPPHAENAFCGPNSVPRVLGCDRLSSRLLGSVRVDNLPGHEEPVAQARESTGSFVLEAVRAHPGRLWGMQATLCSRDVGQFAAGPVRGSASMSLNWYGWRDSWAHFASHSPPLESDDKGVVVEGGLVGSSI